MQDLPIKKRKKRPVKFSRRDPKTVARNRLAQAKLGSLVDKEPKVKQEVKRHFSSSSCSTEEDGKKKNLITSKETSHHFQTHFVLDIPLSSIVTAQIKAESPAFEAYFECVDLQPDTKSFDNLLIEPKVCLPKESKARPKSAKRVKRNAQEEENLALLRRKIELVQDDIECERLRNIELFKQLEDVNAEVKTFEKLFGFKVKCF